MCSLAVRVKQDEDVPDAYGFSKRGVDENPFDYFLGNDYFIIK
jgi:hypothetical protein